MTIPAQCFAAEASAQEQLSKIRSVPADSFSMAAGQLPSQLAPGRGKESAENLRVGGPGVEAGHLCATKPAANIPVQKNRDPADVKDICRGC
jgi:hypothetical protein